MANHVLNDVIINVNFDKEPSPTVQDINSGDSIDTITKKVDSSIRAHTTDIEGKANKAIVTSSTITATGWTGDAAPYSQSITVSGVLADSIVEVSPSSAATSDNVNEFSALQLSDGGQSTNTITLKANGVKNTTDIPINIIVRN